nr:bulb-type lectin domain-containing protein [Ipomoea batatas]
MSLIASEREEKPMAIFLVHPCITGSAEGSRQNGVGGGGVYCRSRRFAASAEEERAASAEEAASAERWRRSIDRRRSQERARTEGFIYVRGVYTDVHELDKGESGNLKVFSYDWAVATTNNFSLQYKLGQGGFGGVYKAWELWNRGAVLQLVDPTLNSMFGSEEQLHRCINVGLLCVEELAVDRPSMSDVISMLTNENLAMARPKKPAFVLRYSAARGFQEESHKFTVNQLSISATEAR